MDRHPTTTGIVLAGGRSSRFGSDKMAADYRGQPLLRAALGLMGSLADHTILVLSPDGAVPEQLPDRVSIARDPDPYEGPLAGLSAGLQHATAPFALVVGGDMPRLVDLVLRQMGVVLEISDADAVALLEQGKRRPLPLALRTRVRERLAEALARGERSLKGFLDTVNVIEVEEPTWRKLDPEGGSLVDVDSPDDLRT
jgi:molybdopterin-guanine dinucleotide biosynthesis protein A